MQRSGRLLGLIASLALAALTASPASAAVVVDTTGSHGRYAVKDNDNHQGARCAYETASLDLDRITVHGPTVWARDKTSHRDGQWVGWNLLVQKRPAAGGAWSTVHTSTTDQRYAYDDAPASFDQQTWKAPEHVGNASWRIEVLLTWYHFVETGPQPVEGTVTLRLKHYTDRWNGNIYPDQPLCVSHF